MQGNRRFHDSPNDTKPRGGELVSPVEQSEPLVSQQSCQRFEVHDRLFVMLTTIPLTFNNDRVRQRVKAFLERRADQANNATISDYIYIYFLGRRSHRMVCRRCVVPGLTAACLCVVCPRGGVPAHECYCHLTYGIANMCFPSQNL